jgi:prolycopene isomerase
VSPNTAKSRAETALRRRNRAAAGADRNPSAPAGRVPIPTTRSRGRRADYDAIVIGSGVGGSVTAALLARHGERVLVLEKNPVLGGILASYERDGFKLDVGSHLIARGARGPLAAVLGALGRTRPRFITHRIPVRSRGMLELAAPEHRHQLPAYALEAARLLRLPAADTLSLARMMFQVLTLTEPELRRLDRTSLDQFIVGHTRHPGAYFMFSFLASIFFVLPPWQVSAGEAIRALRHVILDYSLSYVEGGMDSIAHSLLGVVDEAGGDLVTSARVVSIRQIPTGLLVASEDGAEYRARSVAANLAPADLVALLPGVGLPDDWRARVRSIRGSGNAHQIKLGFRRPLVEEGCLIAGVSLGGRTLGDLSLELMQETVRAIEVGSISDPLAIYAPVPTNYDPSLASDGRQLIVASIYGPTTTQPADPPERWRQTILEAFASIIPGFWQELSFVEFTAVPAIGAWMGKGNRAAICNGQFPGQVGRDRLPVTTPVPGLFLCGDGAGGRGIGTELAASSGVEAAVAILRAARGRAREAA